MLRRRNMANTAKIIDGKAISASIREQIKQDTKGFITKTGVKPGLAVILVGEDPASKIYVRNKKKAIEDLLKYNSQRHRNKQERSCLPSESPRYAGISREMLSLPLPALK